MASRRPRLFLDLVGNMFCWRPGGNNWRALATRYTEFAIKSAANHLIELTIDFSFFSFTTVFAFPCQEQHIPCPHFPQSLSSNMRFSIALAALPVALVAASPAGKRCTGTISSLDDVTAAQKCTTVSALHNIPLGCGLMYA